MFTNMPPVICNQAIGCQRRTLCRNCSHPSSWRSCNCSVADAGISGKDVEIRAFRHSRSISSRKTSIVPALFKEWRWRSVTIKKSSKTGSYMSCSSPINNSLLRAQYLLICVLYCSNITTRSSASTKGNVHPLQSTSMAVAVVLTQTHTHLEIPLLSRLPRALPLPSHAVEQLTRLPTPFPILTSWKNSPSLLPSHYTC